MPGFSQSVIELIHQKALQRKLGAHPDRRTYQRKQHDLGSQQPGP
jgi:hypothetical protein